MYMMINNKASADMANEMANSQRELKMKYFGAIGKRMQINCKYDLNSHGQLRMTSFQD